MSKPHITWDSCVRLWYCISVIEKPKELCTVMGKGDSPHVAFSGWQEIMRFIESEKGS